MVVIEMANGKKIKIELYPEIAPISCENFEKLVKQGFYDGLIFHRVIPGFMIQGGCPDGTGMGGPGWNIKGVETQLVGFVRNPVGFVFFATTIVLDSHVFVPERRATGVVGVQNRDVFAASGEASGDEHGCRRFSDAAFDVGDRDKNRAFQHAVFSSVHVFRRQGGGVGRAFFMWPHSV